MTRTYCVCVAHPQCIKKSNPVCKNCQKLYHLGPRLRMTINWPAPWTFWFIKLFLIHSSLWDHHPHLQFMFKEREAQRSAAVCPRSHSQPAVKLRGHPGLPGPTGLSLPTSWAVWSNSLCHPSPFRQIQLLWKIPVELSRVRQGPIKAFYFSLCY